MGDFKEIILGKLTSSIFHDISSPLLCIGLKMEMLKELCKEIKEGSLDQSLTSDDYIEIATEFEKHINSMNKQVLHISNLSNIIKNQLITNNSIENIDLYALSNDLNLILKDHLKSNSTALIFENFNVDTFITTYKIDLFNILISIIIDISNYTKEYKKIFLKYCINSNQFKITLSINNNKVDLNTININTENILDFLHKTNGELDFDESNLTLSFKS